MDSNVRGAAMFINKSENIRCLNCNADGLGWLITKSLGYESDQELIARAESMGYVREDLYSDTPIKDDAFQPLDDDHECKQHPMFPPFEDDEEY